MLSLRATGNLAYTRELVPPLPSMLPHSCHDRLGRAWFGGYHDRWRHDQATKAIYGRQGHQVPPCSPSPVSLALTAPERHFHESSSVWQVSKAHIQGRACDRTHDAHPIPLCGCILCESRARAGALAWPTFQAAAQNWPNSQLPLDKSVIFSYDDYICSNSTA